MIGRRRAASLLAFVVAGLAVAGTTPAPPSPGPTQRIDLRGSLHLTAAAPVAIQRIDVQGETANLESLAMAATLSGLPDDGSVIATIEAIDGSPGGSVDPAAPTRAGDSAAVNVTFPFSCRTSSCTGAYALVLTWIGAPDGGGVDIPWSLTTTARFRPSYTSATPPPDRITVTAAATGAGPESAELSSTTSGKPVHLSETYRFRAWTVSFHWDGIVEGQAETRPITQASLRTIVSQTAGGPFGAGATKDRREDGRLDPPVQVRVFAQGGRPEYRWPSDGALTFNPLPGCAAAGPCDGAATIVLAWADGRPDTAFDAAWTMDLAAIGLTAKITPIEATVIPADPAELAVATASGSFETSLPTTRGQSEFVAAVTPGLDATSPWAQLGLPARAIATVRVTSIGATPLPADAIISVHGQGQLYTSGPALGSSVEVHPGEEATFAFEPTVVCASGRLAACEVRGSIGSSILSPGPNAAPDGIAIRVDWTLQLGVTSSTSSGLVIVVDPTASPGSSR